MSCSKVAVGIKKGYKTFSQFHCSSFAWFCANRILQ